MIRSVCASRRRLLSTRSIALVHRSFLYSSALRRDAADERAARREAAAAQRRRDLPSMADDFVEPKHLKDVRLLTALLVLLIVVDCAENKGI